MTVANGIPIYGADDRQHCAIEGRVDHTTSASPDLSTAYSDGVEENPPVFRH